MATYKIGEVVNGYEYLGGPVGSPQSWKKFAPAKQAPQPETSSGFDMDAFKGTMQDLPNYAMDALRSGGMGLLDIATGSGQLMSHLPGVPDEYTQRYEDSMKNLEQSYQAGRYSDGFDVGRVTGNVVPMMGVMPAAPAPTMLGRAAQGAKLGTILSIPAKVDTETPFTGSYWGDKALQTGTGFVAGATITPSVELAGKGVTAGVNKGAQMLRAGWNQAKNLINPGMIPQKVTVSLQKAGFDPSKFPAEIKAEIQRDIQTALNSGNNLDDEAIARYVKFKALGIFPTQGQVTRNSAQYGFERNIANSGEIGQDVAERLKIQNRQLLDKLDDLKSGTGWKNEDAYDAGQEIIKQIKQADDEMRAAVTKSYEAARDAIGVNTSMPQSGIAQDVSSLLDDYGDDVIPGAIKKKIMEFGWTGAEKVKSFTVGEADKLIKTINKNWNPMNKAQHNFLTDLRRVVQKSLDDIADDPNVPAAALFDAARGEASKRFSILGASKALTAVENGKASADDFIDKFIIRPSATVDDVAALADYLKMRTGSGFTMARRGLADWLKRAATNNADDEVAIFSASAFEKAMDKVGKRKLSMFFSEDELAQMGLMREVGQYIQKPPQFSGVNTSMTTPAAVAMLNKASKIPVLGPLAGSPGELWTAHLANKAANQPLSTFKGLNLDAPIERMGLLSSPLGWGVFGGME